MHTAIPDPKALFPLLPDTTAAQATLALGRFREYRVDKPG